MSIDVAKYREMVRGPGKFEGEPPETAYYWEAMLNGDGDDHPETDAEWCLAFVITQDEADAFNLPEGECFYLEGTSSGFVYGGTSLTV